MYKNKPEMAKEWEKETPKGIPLPERLSEKKPKTFKDHVEAYFKNKKPT